MFALTFFTIMIFCPSIYIFMLFHLRYPASLFPFFVAVTFVGCWNPHTTFGLDFFLIILNKRYLQRLVSDEILIIIKFDSPIQVVLTNYGYSHLFCLHVFLFLNIPSHEVLLLTHCIVIITSEV